MSKNRSMCVTEGNIRNTPDLAYQAEGKKCSKLGQWRTADRIDRGFSSNNSPKRAGYMPG